MPECDLHLRFVLPDGRGDLKVQLSDGDGVLKVMHLHILATDHRGSAHGGRK